MTGVSYPSYDVEARVDFETRCDLRLGKKHKDNRGVARYFASPHWKALILRYRIGDGPLRRWTFRDGMQCPVDLAEHIRRGGRIRAFNASFERQCFNQLHFRFGWPRPAIDRYRCTAVEAAAMALPRSLGGVGVALGLPEDQQKDARGKELIDFFCQPIRRLKRHEHLPPGPIFNEPDDHPEQFEEFVDYCGQDVVSEGAVAERLFPLSDADQEAYVLDQIINDRGLRIDLQSVHAALKLADKTRAKLEAELLALTGGIVTGVNKTAEMVRWLKTQGIDTDSVAKAEIADLLEFDDLPEKVRRVLEIRQQGAKSSTAKFQTLIDRASDDGRVRHSFIFNAAGPGRWSSRGFQAHNLPRPRKIFGDAHLDLHTLFETIRSADPDQVEFMYGPELGQPMPLLADALKSFIWAEPGHDLMEVDYSGIQNANGAWIAGETWKLDAMREIIAEERAAKAEGRKSNAVDMYRRTAAGIYGEPIEKSDVRRQVGKVADLSLQFEGGVSALYSMARNYNLKLGPVFPPVWAAADEERREKAVKRYERCLKRGEAKANILSREAWIAGELIKIGFRASHPAICDAWALLRDAVYDAVSEPGTQVNVLCFQYIVAHNFLWCKLPSGRCLAYPAPRLRDMVWFKDAITLENECITAEQGYARQRAGEGRVTGAAKASVTVLGVDNKNRFLRYGLYGGLIFQNNVMGVEVDVLRHGLKNAERAGYATIGHIHDAGLFEVLRGFGSVRELEAIMCQLPACYASIPLSASGYRSKRLRKD